MRSEYRTTTIAGIFLLLFLIGAGDLLAQGSTSRRDVGGTTTWTYMNDGEGFRVESRGEIVFRDDDRGVARIADGGFMTVELIDGRRSRKLDIRPSTGGNLDYTYFVNDRRAEYDAAARRAFEDVFVEIIRESGVGADERVARILKTGGIDDVFEEIELIRSSSSTRRYMVALVEQADLGADELVRAARLAETDIPSSGDRSNFLRTAAPQFFAHRASLDAYFDAVQSIPSSGDRSKTLLSALEYEIDRDLFLRLLDAASGIPSSGDKTRVLVAAAGRHADDESVRTAYFDTIETIPSSGDRSRLILLLLTEYELDDASTAKAFEAARSIPSSGDKARVLAAAAPNYTGSAAQREMFFTAVNSIPSSGDRARVLLKLLEHESLDRATLIGVLESIRTIPSSSDAGRVLHSLAPLMNDDELVDEYLKTADTIGSESERGRALSALIRRQG